MHSNLSYSSQQHHHQHPNATSNINSSSNNNNNINQGSSANYAIYEWNGGNKPPYHQSYGTYWKDIQPMMTRTTLARDEKSCYDRPTTSYKTATTKTAADNNKPQQEVFNSIGEPHGAAKYTITQFEQRQQHMANTWSHYAQHHQERHATKTRLLLEQSSPNRAMPVVHRRLLQSSIKEVENIQNSRTAARHTPPQNNHHHHHHHHHQKLQSDWDRDKSNDDPTWNSILSNQQSLASEQHYQHYYSYFYNRNPNAKPLRRLPMNNVSTKFPNTSHKDVSEPINSNQLATPGDFASPTHKKTHLPKEKLPNNNIKNGYDNGEWLQQHYEKNHNEEDLVKIVEDFHVVHEDQHKQTHDNLTRPKRLYRTRSECEIPAPISPVKVEGNGDGSNVTTKNMEKNAQKIVVPRLPLTPKRLKAGGGTIPKKVLPNIHRVLLYNNQSPRTLRKTRNKQTTELAARGVRVAMIPPRPAQDTKTSDEKTSIGFDHDDGYDDDADDDLDNVSNFDGSDDSSMGSDGEDGYRAYAYKLTHSIERLSTTQSFLSSQSSEESLKSPQSLLVPSLFPNVPPYLSFSSNTQKGPSVPAELHRVLKWRVTNIMPKVVRFILANSGMRLLKKTNDWMGVWGKHLKSPCFKTIRCYQKINHLPGSFRIGRKDSCWKNLQRQMSKHSKREFGFMPRTYIIPNDLCVLRKHWPKYAQRNTKWIIKPPASARGAGIRVVNRWAQIPKRRPLIVQKYIERPLLINGSKFDLRLYVLVTSMNPLRVYMYHNGLARFASVKYSAKADTLNDRCMHLTNYSINKFSSNYSKNEDVNACHGHKWTIKSLWTYLANRGVRTDYLWEALRSLVLRTILAGENSMNNMIKMNVESKYSVFELFGFDVILDADLVPWLLEVNISPSLHSELPLDAHVKAPLVQSVLNTALYNVPPKLTLEKQKELAAEFSLPPGSPFCYDKRLYINYLSREEKIKHNAFCRKSLDDRQEYLNDILNKLTPDDVRCLIIAEDELARCAPLERIFPTEQTHKYLRYTDSPRYYNRLMDAWETRYGHNREEGIALLSQLCQQKYHLQVPAPPAKKILKFRPRTLILTRPTAPSTLFWKPLWMSQRSSKRICLKYRKQQQHQQHQQQQQQQSTNNTKDDDDDGDDDDDDDSEDDNNNDDDDNHQENSNDTFNNIHKKKILIETASSSSSLSSIESDTDV